MKKAVIHMKKLCSKMITSWMIETLLTSTLPTHVKEIIINLLKSVLIAHHKNDVSKYSVTYYFDNKII